MKPHEAIDATGGTRGLLAPGYFDGVVSLGGEIGNVPGSLIMRISTRTFLAMAAIFVAAAGFGQVASGESSEEEKPVQIVLYPAAEPRPA